MTKLCLSLAALAMTAALTPALWGQQAPGGSDQPGVAKEEAKKPDKSVESLIQDLKKASLDDLLARALKNNPDLKVAESKVRDAEAELNRSRAQVMQKVTMLYYEIRAAKAAADEADARLARAEVLFKSRNMPEEEFGTYRLAAVKYRADLATKEAALPYLVGKQSERKTSALAFSPDGKFLATAEGVFETATGKLLLGAGNDRNARVWVPDGGTISFWDAAGANHPKGTMADKIRQALDTPVIAQFDDTPAQDVLVYFQNNVKGVNFVLSVKNPQAPATMSLSEAVPLGAALQCFEDTMGWKIIVREYGLVITEANRLPPDAVLLMHFWKAAPAKKSAAP